MVVSQKKFTKVVIKHDNNMAKAAKELGVTKQAVSKRLRKNPAIKQAILNVREAALKQAGLSRAFVYKGIKEGCKATVVSTVDGLPFETKIADHSERKHFLKIALELHKDLDPDKEQSKDNISTVIFNIIHNPIRKVIDVI